MSKGVPEIVTLFPLPNISSFVEAQNHALDAAMEVGEVLTDMGRTLIQHHIDALQENLREGTEHTKILLSTQDFSTGMARHFEYLQTVATQANKQACDITDLALKTTNGIFDILTSRIRKGTPAAEVKSLIKATA